MLSMPRRDPNPARLLAAALIQAVPGARITAHDETPWASATFVGSRHVLEMQCPDAAAAQGAAGRLPEAEFNLRGHLVADVGAVATGALLALEILVLVDA